MHKLRKRLLPLLLVIAMLLMSGSTFAAASPTPKNNLHVKVIEKKFYTGRRTRPKHIVYDDYGNVVPKKYYTPKYKNNLHAGTATLKVYTKAPYTGNPSTTFKIRRTKTRLKVTKPSKDSYRVYARIRNYKGQWIRDAAMYGARITYALQKTKVATVNRTGTVRQNKKQKGTVVLTVRVRGNNDIYPQIHRVKLRFK